MDGHSAANRRGVISYTRAPGCGTAVRKRRGITLHLRATGNELLHKGLDLPCIIYASINFPSCLYLLCKFSPVCLWARPWFSTSGCEAPLYCGGALQGTMHNKQIAGFTVATSSLPVKLYPWDCSKFTVSPSHGDACRCVKPNKQEEKKGRTVLWNLTRGN